MEPGTKIVDFGINQIFILEDPNIRNLDGQEIWIWTSVDIEIERLNVIENESVEQRKPTKSQIVLITRYLLAIYPL